MRRLVLLAVLAFLFAAETVHAAEENVLPNGSFDRLNAKGDFASSWGRNDPHGITLVPSGDGHYVRIVNDDSKKVVNMHAMLRLKPEWYALRISVRLS